MRPIRIPLNYRLTGEPFDARVAQLTCILAGIAILPLAVMALVRHRGSQAEFLLGLGLAGLVALLFVMLGILCRHGGVGWQGFGYVTMARVRKLCRLLRCHDHGHQSLAGLGLTPVQITLGLLLPAL